ncbi:MAG: Hsp20/alpha crystallin family protein [Synechocystis sp.]|jgi:HSP20 family protein
MALIHWEPSPELGALQREINRVFDNFIAPLTDHESGWAFTPPVEIGETKDAIVVMIELPGMKQTDIEVEASTDQVMIRGERPTTFQTRLESIFHSELRYGKFHRTIPLPMEIDNQHIHAEYEAGVLTITLPKTASEIHQTVTVKLA